ncbi:hypothetical protein Taro_015819 [Colocasia esculenta]|uniref:Uncharacterized protein n=1 Tax=Colocasia esculenta TaxID=4460 RepID=A0A843UNF4_COLES|nr:hypothetical protein [Colocasia esculenta]
MAMKMELKQHQILYPITIDKFLQYASFGSFCTFMMSLDHDEYGPFISAQRKLHIQRMAPIMGPSYPMEYGAFQSYFEEQESFYWCGMTGLITTEVPVMTVIPVATTRVAGELERPVRLSRFPGWLRSGRGGGGHCVTVGNATARPVAFWEPQAKIHGRLSLPLFWHSSHFLHPSEEERFPLSFSPAVRLVVALAARVERRRGSEEEAAVHGEGLLLSMWGTPGRSIPAVGLPADVATAEHVATSEKASPRSDTTLSRIGNPSSPAPLQFDLLPCLAQQASLQRFPLIPTSFLLKGWPATSGDGARFGKLPFATTELLLEVVDTLTSCVDTLSRSGNWVFWNLGLVSTLPGTVSTHLTLSS